MKLNKEQKQQAMELYRQGKTKRDIAAELGFDYQAVVMATPKKFSYDTKRKNKMRALKLQEKASSKSFKKEVSYEELKKKYERAVALLIEHGVIGL